MRTETFFSFKKSTEHKSYFKKKSVLKIRDCPPPANLLDPPLP